MLAFTGNFGRQVIEEMYPSLETPGNSSDAVEFPETLGTQTVVHSAQPQALQAVDMPALMALAMQTGGCVEVAASVGDTLITGMTLLRVFGGNRLINDEIWRGTFETGPDRTFNQDPQVRTSSIGRHRH